MRIIIDRFEGNFAICECAPNYETQLMRFDRAFLPENAREGDTLVFLQDGWRIHEDATAELFAAVRKLEEDLFI